MYTILTQIVALSLVGVGLHADLAIGAKLPSAERGLSGPILWDRSQLPEVNRPIVALPIGRRMDGKSRVPTSKYSKRSSLESRSLPLVGTTPNGIVQVQEEANARLGPTLYANVTFGGVGKNVTYQLAVEMSDGLVSINNPDSNSTLVSGSNNTGWARNYTNPEGNFALAYAYNNTIYLGDNIALPNAPFVLYENVWYGVELNGDLGMAPSTANVGYLKRLTTGETVVPLSFVEQLYAGNIIKNNMFSISAPPPLNGETFGELIIGGADSTKYIGKIDYIPRSDDAVVAQYWGVETSITYGNSTENTTNISEGPIGAVLDVGFELALSPDMYKNYITATEAKPDNTTGLLIIEHDKVANLQSLNFKLGNTTYELVANAQILPQDLNALYGGVENATYLNVVELTNTSTEITVVRAVLGNPFFQRYYLLFDEENERIGIAETKNTYAVV